MIFIKNTLWLKRIAMFILFLIVALILWNTYDFFQKFKQEERSKMEILAKAQKEIATNKNLEANINLPVKILSKNKNIPTILTTENDEIISFNNLDLVKAKDINYLKKQLELMKKQNKPIEINYLEDKKQYVYYRNSDLLNKLTYYPMALLLILLLFLSVVYLFFNSNKVAEQNKLWTGMAKETAHQIGTPLSSLLGWIEILRSENVNKNYILEIEKDINRLNIIANRFSKIGSIPVLENENIIPICKATLEYLKSRSSKQIDFNFFTSNKNIIIKHNKELIGWVLENLIKNSIDAMQGKGSIVLAVKKTDNGVAISLSDSGKGIPKYKFKEIFRAGYTTKKRGWGLGLSLSKRIIESYHKGKIFVKKSEPNKGTTFKIMLFE